VTAASQTANETDRQEDRQQFQGVDITPSPTSPLSTAMLGQHPLGKVSRSSSLPPAFAAPRVAQPRGLFA
jgi:hypothetical protein